MQNSTFEKNGRRYILDGDGVALEVRYGLPGEVKFCKRCVISNQRAAPSVVIRDNRDSIKETITFGDDGLCEACRVVEKKDEIDWDEREAQLLVLLDRYRSRNGSYDCIVPGSGGKDSAFAAHILKNKYGMNPLTVTWAPHLYTDVGQKNFVNWLHVGGFDNYLFTADGTVQRKLTRLAFENLLHPFQPFTLGQRHFPSRIAAQLGIPLVFYGENAAEYGAGKGEDEQSLVPVRYLTDDQDASPFISGFSEEELASKGIPAHKLTPYLPMKREDFISSGLQVHYLGHFIKWVPQDCFYYAVENTGFNANDQRTEGTFSKYNSIDDKLDGFHYWCGFVKFGIGRCTHEASQEIRHGHIDREEACALVHRFDGEFPSRYFKEVLEYLDLDKETFFGIADKFRSPHLWKKTAAGWELRHRVEPLDGTAAF